MAADAQRRVGATESDLEDLKRRITTMEERQGATYELAKATYDAHESLRKTFNKNVDIDNRRSDAIDTQLGNCGKQWIQGDQGWVTVNRDCSKLPAKK